MASWAVLVVLSGFQYDGVEHSMGFALNPGRFLRRGKIMVYCLKQIVAQTG